MPNSRRRKFSVRKGIAGRQPPQVQNDLQTSGSGSVPEALTKADNQIIQYYKPKNKIHPSSSRIITNTNFMIESKSSGSVDAVNKYLKGTVDKTIEASSSNLKLFDIIHLSDDVTEPWKENEEVISIAKNAVQRFAHDDTRDKTSPKREKYPHQHRIKVRSPKRRLEIANSENQKSSYCKKLACSIGTEAIDWKEVYDYEQSYNATTVVDSIDEERQSDQSSDDMCRICHSGDTSSTELGQLISACACRGTVGRVHVKCLERWLTESGKSRCELCGTRYTTRRVHKYGVPRALVMWILSQNAKQLMVDSLGIVLMSPLAVLAAWLSGRTLAGLMTQDAHATPWPLASTFVLACMTLVCYYCWIVSAATRHALGWWIWYRSQYEVRLQFLDAEE